jgi:hypothetical protein
VNQLVDGDVAQPIDGATWPYDLERCHPLRSTKAEMDPLIIL